MDRHAHPVTYTDRAVCALKRPRAPERARESRCLTATIAPSCMHGGHQRVGYDEEACYIACEHAPARPGGREQFSCAPPPSAAAPHSVRKSRDRNRARGGARARALHHRHGKRVLSRAQTNSGSIGEGGGAQCLSTDQPRHLGVCTHLSAEADPLISTARLHLHQLTRCLFVLWTVRACRAGGAEHVPARRRARDSGRAICARCVALLPRGAVRTRTALARQGALVHAHRLCSKPPHHTQRAGARHACRRARWWP